MTSIPHEKNSGPDTGNTHLDSTTHMTDDDEAKGTAPARTMMQRRAETPSQSSESPNTTRRKRLSFFRRSNSVASTKASLRPFLQPTVPLDALSAQSRPGTSNSEHRRRTTDPLESIRNSIFRGRKNEATDRSVHSTQPLSRRSRFSHSVDQAHTGLVSFASPLRIEEIRPQSKEGYSFKNEKEFYRHRKKSSISPPFNFQHVIHTPKRHLPRLDTVDEKELQARLSMANARLQRELQANDLESERTNQLSLISMNGKPAEKVNNVRPSQDETRFDETQDTRIDPDEHFHIFGEAQLAERSPIRSPRHSSSTPVPNSPIASSAAHTTQHLRTQTSHDELSRKRTRSPPATDSPARTNPSIGSKSPGTLTSVRSVKLPQSRPPRQCLPAVPPQAIMPPQHVGSTRTSKGFMGPSPRSVAGLIVTPPMAPIPNRASVQSKRSSKSVAASNTPGSRTTDILEEPSWEDDIDFAFEQGAEAMCDFDWDSIPATLLEQREDEGNQDVDPLPHPQPSPDSASSPDGSASGVRLSQWTSQPSALASEATQCSPAVDQTSQQQRKRVSSVGHRGFQAARNALSDSVYFLTFDGGVAEYLSDPESIRTGGSRHRKSSSYGSYSEYSGQSLKTASDTTRWSSASTSTSPDVLHSSAHAASKRKSRSSATRGILKLPESILHSPNAEGGEVTFDKPVMPGARPPHSDRALSDGVIFMRRPATAGDRALLFNSGRVVQRSRSSTPNRMAVQSLHVVPPAVHEGGWI